MRCLQFMFAPSRIVTIGFTIAWLILQAQLTLAQPLLVPGQNGVNLFGNANNNGGNQNANGNANNGQGGAAQADFDTLIELVTSTIAPDQWDVVGGPGTIQGFPGGVYVDASGVMKRVSPSTRSLLARRFKRFQPEAGFADDEDHSQRSELRLISLRQLERQLQACTIREEPPTEAMKFLAGLERIDYVIIDQEGHDVILAGPAGRWMRADDGRIVSYSTRRPVLQLDDLVVLFRNALHSHGKFTCSITPTQAGLSEFSNYVEQTTQKPLKTGTRKKWVTGLQDALGNQTIDVEGLSAETRVGRVIVEADYHMKLVGIGLEPGPEGVVSYLDSIEIAKGQSPPPMSVLRWWFTLKNDQLGVSLDGSTFDLTQPAVQLLSENQLLTKLGQRIRTGQSDRLNREFARSFTSRFDALAKRYPVYADLENVFELAIVASLVRQAREDGTLDWAMSHLLDQHQIAIARVAREVPSIVNHRFVNGKHVVCAVSGGVSFDNRLKTSSDGSAGLVAACSKDAHESVAWWWDYSTRDR